MKRDSDRHVVELKLELQALQEEHRRVTSSFSYRLGVLLSSAMHSPRRLFRLPLDLWLLLRERRATRQDKRADPRVVSQIATQWMELAQQAIIADRPVVFLFSGTTSVQGVRGNRPIRQTQALLRRGAAVFFSYHRSRTDEALPDPQHPFLVQSPVDVTLELLEQLATTDLGGCRKLFIISYPLPGVEHFVERFRQQGWGVIYDCRDDWEEFSKVGMARWFDARVERQLVQECDATLCVSGPLVHKMQALAPGRKVVLMPNAVEHDYLPADYQRSPVKPSVVGYFGHLSGAWFDWSALIKVAVARQELRFEIIGHSAPQDLVLPDNLVLLGPKPWDVLHEYAARWSAAIIPFRMGALADGVDPIKIYEYLALQLPVVSFRMPQIEKYPFTWTVDSVDAFCRALDEACQCQPDKEVLASFLAKNTWEVRAEQLLILAKEGLS
ncbi:hypothetical protein D9M68_538350 [compost metagenome]